MDAHELKVRTKRYALNVIEFCDSLPHRKLAWVLGDQLMRAATSVGANYRAACKARSTAEFIAKIGTVEEEADECQYWLELIGEAKLASRDIVQPLLKEATELTAIMGASRKSASRRLVR